MHHKILLICSITKLSQITRNIWNQNLSRTTRTYGTLFFAFFKKNYNNFHFPIPDSLIIITFIPSNFKIFFLKIVHMRERFSYIIFYEFCFKKADVNFYWIHWILSCATKLNSEVSHWLNSIKREIWIFFLCSSE